MPYQSFFLCVITVSATPIFCPQVIPQSVPHQNSVHRWYPSVSATPICFPQVTTVSQIHIFCVWQQLTSASNIQHNFLYTLLLTTISVSWYCVSVSLWQQSASASKTISFSILATIITASVSIILFLLSPCDNCQQEILSVSIIYMKTVGDC